MILQLYTERDGTGYAIRARLCTHNSLDNTSMQFAHEYQVRAFILMCRDITTVAVMNNLQSTIPGNMRIDLDSLKDGLAVDQATRKGRKRHIDFTYA